MAFSITAMLGCTQYHSERLLNRLCLKKSKKNMTLPFLMTLMMNTKRAVKKADQSLIFGRNLTYELCCKNHSEI